MKVIQKIDSVFGKRRCLKNHTLQNYNYFNGILNCGLLLLNDFKEFLKLSTNFSRESLRMNNFPCYIFVFTLRVIAIFPSQRKYSISTSSMVFVKWKHFHFEYIAKLLVYMKNAIFYTFWCITFHTAFILNHSCTFHQFKFITKHFCLRLWLCKWRGANTRIFQTQ